MPLAICRVALLVVGWLAFGSGPVGAYVRRFHSGCVADHGYAAEPSSQRRLQARAEHPRVRVEVWE